MYFLNLFITIYLCNIAGLLNYFYMNKIQICLIVLLLKSSLIFSQTLTGIASYYNNSFNGKRTANGEIFSNSKLTCACNRLPLNTKIKVTNLKNNKSIIVKVNDRLAASNNRVVDLSYVAAKELGFINSGLTKVKVEVLGKNMPMESDKKEKVKKPKDDTKIMDNPKALEENIVTETQDSNKTND